MAYSGIALGKHETALLAEWDRRRQREVTIRDIATGVGSKAAAATAAALVRKGVLDRIGRGIYVVRPLRAFGRRWTLSALVAVEVLLRGVPHYVGGLAAFTVHRLSQQVYGSAVDVYVVQYRPPRRLANARVVFHRLPAGRFGFGLTTVSVEGTEVTMSDPARTLLDALDYPDSLGGLPAALPLVAAALGRVDHQRLVEYALRGSPSSTCQRLGLLLERMGAPGAVLAPLLQRVEASKSVPAMVPGALRVGRVNPRWRTPPSAPPAGCTQKFRGPPLAVGAYRHTPRGGGRAYGDTPLHVLPASGSFACTPPAPGPAGAGRRVPRDGGARTGPARRDGKGLLPDPPPLGPRGSARRATGTEGRYVLE